MAKWKCEICGNKFDNFHAQGFDNKIYCPLCYFKKENQELKKKYKNAVVDYEITMFEKEQLNSLVNSCQEEIRELKKQVEEYQQELEKADSITQSCIFNGKEESKISYRKCLNILDKKEAQQKEFIDYMNKTIEELECDDVDDEEMKGYLIQRIDTFKEILQKYKSIIGYKDEQN